MTRNSAAAGRLPVVLSAFLFPGVGQAVQGRWAAACGFALVFGALLAAFLVHAIGILVAVYRLAFEFATYDPPPLRPIRAALFFALAMVVYLANVVDSYRAWIMQSRRQRLRDREAELQRRVASIVDEQEGADP